jgi:hypothetical protein
MSLTEVTGDYAGRSAFEKSPDEERASYVPSEREQAAVRDFCWSLNSEGFPRGTRRVGEKEKGVFCRSGFTPRSVKSEI